MNSSTFLKIIWFSSALGLLSTLSLAFPTKVSAYEFKCATFNGVLATVLDSQRGPRAIIYWRVTTEMTPQERCRNASSNFQAAHDNGLLNYLVLMRRSDNRYDLCISDRENGECLNSLFTLAPGSNPSQILGRILNIQGLMRGRGIEQNDNRQLYVRFNEYLDGILPMTSDVEYLD